MKDKPVIGVLLGDSAGVGPELVAKVLKNGEYEQYCYPVIIGDVRIFERGCMIAEAEIPHCVIKDVGEADWTRGIPVLDQEDQNPDLIPLGKSSEYCGKAIINAITTAVNLCKEKKIEGFFFAPFNKTAMKLSGCPFESEDYLMAHLFELTGPFGEISVLDNVIAARITSHVPIKDVSENLTEERIMKAIKHCAKTLKQMGIQDPAIGVAALNPHGGEEGTCGREEIEVIEPTIKKAQEQGIKAMGPYPGDTLFRRAFNGDFDGVVTMYHDQGQIALKTAGFERGVTISGGMPVPIVTCSHGSAYDIAGKNIVDPTSLENAMKMTCRMAMAMRG